MTSVDGCMCSESLHMESMHVSFADAQRICHAFCLDVRL